MSLWDRASASWASPLLHTAEFAAVVLLSFALTLFDFFGMSSALSAIAKDIGYLIFADEVFANSASDAQDISIVLLSDSDLSAMDRDMPLSHADAAEMIEQIVSVQPRALFIDFLFLDPREEGGFDRLSRALQLAEKHLESVVIASPPVQVAMRQNPSRKAFYDQVERTGIELGSARLVGFERRTTVMPPPGGTGSTARPAAALLCDTLCDGATAPPWQRLEGNAGIELAWRSRPPTCAPRDEAACAAVAKGWLQRLWTSLLPSLSNWLARSREEDPATDGDDAINSGGLQGLKGISLGVPPYRTLSVTDLQTATGLSSLRGNVVFLGAAVTGASDFALSPIYRYVPGVMAHAAYFDNLRSFGDDAFLTTTGFKASWMADFVVICVLALGMFAVRWSCRATFSKKYAPDIDIFLSFLVISGLSLLIAAVELLYLRGSPDTWLTAPQMLISVYILRNLQQRLDAWRSDESP